MIDVSAIVLMVLIFGFTWGGLLYFVNLAYKREKKSPLGRENG